MPIPHRGFTSSSTYFVTAGTFNKMYSCSQTQLPLCAAEASGAPPLGTIS